MNRQGLTRLVGLIFGAVLMITATTLVACNFEGPEPSPPSLETSIQPGREGPTTLISAPTTGQQFEQGQKIEIQSESVDEQGILRLELLVDNQVVSSSEFVPQPQTVFVAKQTWLAVEPGSHTLQVRAYNPANTVSQSQKVMVEIISTTPMARSDRLRLTPTPLADRLTASPTPPSIQNSPTASPTTLTPTPVPPTVTPTETVAAPPTSTPLPTATSTSTPAQANIQFGADQTQIRAGECVTIFWHVTQAQEVYYQGQGVAGENQARRECPTNTQSFELRVVNQDGTADTRNIVIQVEGGGYRTIEMDEGDTVDFDKDGRVTDDDGDDFEWVEISGERRFRKWDDDDDLELVPVGPVDNLGIIKKEDCDWALDNLADEEEIEPFPGLAACIKTDDGRMGKIRFQNDDEEVNIEWTLW